MSSIIIEKFDSWSKNTKATILLIGIICILSYGLTLNMYFWKDDFAVMIKAANPEEPVGFLGPGIKGEGAYKYITTPFIFLYPTFGMNALGYFTIGLILYFLSAIALHTLARTITKDNFLALLISLIYSAGYIGADTIYGLMNSYQMSWLIISLCLCLSFFLRSFEEKAVHLYIFSVVFFGIGLETGYIRAHGFFLIILSTFFLLLPQISYKRLLEFLLKIVPFALIFKNTYFNSAPSKVGSANLIQSLSSGNYDYFYYPLATFINTIIPTPFIEWSLSKAVQLVGRSINPLKYNLLLFVLFTIWLVTFTGWLLIRKKLSKEYYSNRMYLSQIYFSLSMILGSFIGVFFIAAGATYLNSTHRYLTMALIGLSFFWVSFFSLVSNLFRPKEKTITLVLSFVVILIYLVLGNIYNYETIAGRTDPQKIFFGKLKEYIPHFSEKSYLYIDYANFDGSNAKVGQIFGTGMAGGSPEIASHYNVDRYSIVSSVGNFDTFIEKYKKEKGKLENTYAFYFENNNLINKTQEFKEILQEGKKQTFTPGNLPLNISKSYTHDVDLIVENNQKVLKNTSFEFNFPENTSSITDGILRFNLKIEPKQIEKTNNEVPVENKIYLEYLLSKTQIKNESKVYVLNYFQNQVPTFLTDNKIETAWMADRGPWHNIIHSITSEVQFIEIHLNSPINIGGILFTNGHELRTPTEYRILSKQSGDWQEIKKVKLTVPKSTNEIWFEKINPLYADQIRIELLNSSSGDAPQISEIELVDEKFSGLDFKKGQLIELDPSILLTRNLDSVLVRDYFAKNGKLSFTYHSNKDIGFNLPQVNFIIKGLNEVYTYEIPVKAGGTNLVKGKFFNLNFPAQYTFSNFEYINPSISYFLNNDQ